MRIKGEQLADVDVVDLVLERSTAAPSACRAAPATAGAPRSGRDARTRAASSPWTGRRRPRRRFPCVDLGDGAGGRRPPAAFRALEPGGADDGQVVARRRFSRKNDPIGAPHFLEIGPLSLVDDDLLRPIWPSARCSSPELWAHVGDLVEEADVTYASGFPEDYSDVFGAPAAALPAF